MRLDAKAVKATGEFNQAIVGESSYQRNIAAALASGSGRELTVAVVHESSNKHDPNAVMVIDLSGRKLGYLPRATAAEYALALKEIQAGGAVIVCQARVLGGESDKPSYGVWIDLCPVDELAQAVPVPGSAQGMEKPVAKAKGCASSALGAGIALCLVLLGDVA